MKNYKIILLIFLTVCVSCKKGFLEEKSNKRLVVPTNIADFQAVLDEAIGTMNVASSHELGVIGADEYSISTSVFDKLPVNMRYQSNAYLWVKDDIYEGAEGTDWNNAYRRILYANIALDGIDKIVPSGTQRIAWNNVKGSGLFFRAFNFYQLAQLFCKSYDPATAAKDPGIPLRLASDILIKSTRASVQETYERILTDLKEAVELLPNTPLTKYRPSKAAAYALLAKTYLQMQDYRNAAFFADQCLSISNKLINLNTLNFTSGYTFPADPDLNPEIIFSCYMLNIQITAVSRINIDAMLAQSYDGQDLRHKAYYNKNVDNRITFKGSYTGGGVFFTGLANDEVLLIRAECKARLEQIDDAWDDISYLIKNRYATSFVPERIIGKEELLDLILKERRKELVLRGIRWEDLRRLNKDARYAKSLSREINNRTYVLPPNDLRYVWPIPDHVIELSGIQQNLR